MRQGNCFYFKFKRNATVVMKRLYFFICSYFNEMRELLQVKEVRFNPKHLKRVITVLRHE